MSDWTRSWKRNSNCRRYNSRNVANYKNWYKRHSSKRFRKSEEELKTFNKDETPYSENGPTLE